MSLPHSLPRWDGAAFGQYGDGYIRFSYANSLANIEEALERIRTVSRRWASASVT